MSFDKSKVETERFPSYSNGTPPLGALRKMDRTLAFSFNTSHLTPSAEHKVFKCSQSNSGTPVSPAILTKPGNLSLKPKTPSKQRCKSTEGKQKTSVKRKTSQNRNSRKTVKVTATASPSLCVSRNLRRSERIKKIVKIKLPAILPTTPKPKGKRSAGEGNLKGPAKRRKRTMSDVAANEIYATPLTSPLPSDKEDNEETVQDEVFQTETEIREGKISTLAVLPPVPAVDDAVEEQLLCSTPAPDDEIATTPGRNSRKLTTRRANQDLSYRSPISSGTPSNSRLQHQILRPTPIRSRSATIERELNSSRIMASEWDSSNSFLNGSTVFRHGTPSGDDDSDFVPITSSATWSSDDSHLPAARSSFSPGPNTRSRVREGNNAGNTLALTSGLHPGVTHANGTSGSNEVSCNVIIRSLTSEQNSESWRATGNVFASGSDGISQSRPSLRSSWYNWVLRNIFRIDSNEQQNRNNSNCGPYSCGLNLFLLKVDPNTRGMGTTEDPNNPGEQYHWRLYHWIHGYVIYLLRIGLNPILWALRPNREMRRVVRGIEICCVAPVINYVKDPRVWMPVAEFVATHVLEIVFRRT